MISQTSVARYVVIEIPSRGHAGLVRQRGIPINIAAEVKELDSSSGVSRRYGLSRNGYPTHLIEGTCFSQQ